MFVQSKKLMPWTKSDYVGTILHFLLHYLIISALILGIIFINGGLSFEGLRTYFGSHSDRRDYIYMMVSLFYIVVIIYLYFYFEFRDFLLHAKNIAVIFVILEISLVICYLTGRYVDVYARPVALCALLVLHLVNKRASIFINIFFCLIMFLIDLFATSPLFEIVQVSKDPIYFSLIIGCTTGILSIHLVDGVRSRIGVFLKGFIIFLPILVCSFAMEISALTVTRAVELILFSFISGMTSVIYMMAILPLFESMFNILTNYRLFELIDHKSKLIQKMKNEAPGTFNHCLVVASLSESCAAAIGENPLLARAAAYYHDIGKLKQPQYFTENQRGVNPHDDLTPELSTEIIRSHTRDGYELIKKYHLPLFLADVALEHHGTLPISYFYAKAKKFTDGEINIADFSYKGPKPQTKIAAIVMLADGCEAAVRAKADRSHERVEGVVRGLIEDRMNADQFSECELTMHDIDIIRHTLVDSLTGVYHDRINYPKINVHRGGEKTSESTDGEPKSEPEAEEPKADKTPARRPARSKRKK